MKTVLGCMGVAMIILAACSSPVGNISNVQVTTSPNPVSQKASGVIVAEGRVLPVRSASLSYKITGVISEVLAVEGQHVEANQVIVRLDSSVQRAASAQAQAGLARAQARLEALKAGPRPQEVAAAQAALDEAEAQMAALVAGARPEDVSSVSAGVSIAQAQLQQVQEGASQEQIDAARADVANTQAVLKQAQYAYDASFKQNPAAIGASPAALALEQATNTYNAAKARYDDLVKGPTAASLAMAKARIAQAAAQLKAIEAPPRQADLDVANANIRRAQAQLDLVKAGTRVEDIAAAQADVDAARAALAQAESAIQDTELRAPFAGTLASLDAHAGEQVIPGAIIARVGDLSQWEIDTTDLTELNITGIKEGSHASITVDALPGVTLPGHVVRIRRFGENKQGDIVYTVVVKPDNQDNRLQWNMTASVRLEP